MRVFVDLIVKHRGWGGGQITIMSATKMNGGCLLAVSYESGDEEAIFVVEEQFGPKRGELRIGWTHKVHESD